MHTIAIRMCREKPILIGISTRYLKWAMLGSNQRPPPCKLGRGCSTTPCPVRKIRLSERFPASHVANESGRVRLRTAPVAARLQHALSASEFTKSHILSTRFLRIACSVVSEWRQRLGRTRTMEERLSFVGYYRYVIFAKPRSLGLYTRRPLGIGPGLLPSLKKDSC